MSCPHSMCLHTHREWCALSKPGNTVLHTVTQNALQASTFRYIVPGACLFPLPSRLRVPCGIACLCCDCRCKWRAKHLIHSSIHTCIMAVEVAACANSRYQHIWLWQHRTLAAEGFLPERQRPAYKQKARPASSQHPQLHPNKSTWLHQHDSRQCGVCWHCLRIVAG